MKFIFYYKDDVVLDDPEDLKLHNYEPKPRAFVGYGADAEDVLKQHFGVLFDEALNTINHWEIVLTENDLK